MLSRESSQQNYAYKMAKNIEKSIKMDKSSLTKLLNTWRKYFNGCQNERRITRLPIDYSKLSEKSILRETLHQIK